MKKGLLISAFVLAAKSRRRPTRLQIAESQLEECKG